MKVAWYQRNGEAREVLHLDEWPDPQPAAGEVRVRVATSGVNPSDVKSRRGRAPVWPHIVPHSDGAGVIESVGAGVSSVTSPPTGRAPSPTQIRVCLPRNSRWRATGSWTWPPRACQPACCPPANPCPVNRDSEGGGDEADPRWQW